MKKYYYLLLCGLLYAATISAQTVASGTTGDCNWTLTGVSPNLTLTISGPGAMENYPNTGTAPWYSYRTFIKALNIGNEVTKIGDYSFSGCSDAISVIITASVSEIGSNAFQDCYALSAVTCMSPVPPAISAGVFDGVDLNVCDLYMPSDKIFLYMGADVWKEFGNRKPISTTTATGVTGPLTWDVANEVLTISGTGVMPAYPATGPWYEHRNAFSKIIIDEGVTNISGNAFTGLAKVMSISISNTVKEIGTLAFSECVRLLSINIPASVTSLGNVIFSKCNALSSITVDAGSTAFSSEDGVLYNKNKTTLVIYPAGKPKNYSIPETVTTIGTYAFSGNFNLTAITISASVTNIEDFAFSNCQALTSISVDAANTNYSSYDGVLFNKKQTTLFVYPCGKQGNFSIPETVTAIYHYAFYSNFILTAITIPALVTTIGDYTFMRCTGLTTVSLPASLKNIGYGAFYNCASLAEIINANPVPQTIVPETFSYVDNDVCILRVPAASVGFYENAEVWKKFNNIVALETEPPEITIKLNKSEIYLLTGATTEILATVTGSETVEWKSSHPEVATVDKGVTITGGNSGETVITAAMGLITAKSPGTTVITASSGMKDADCIVTVIQPGNSTIKGTVDNAGTSSVRVNLYVKLPDTDTKKGIIGGYVLLATTIPNDNGEYSFENLPEGSYMVDVEIDDFESEASPAINLSDGETCSNINFEVNETTGTVAPKIVTVTVETWHAASLQIYPNPFTDVVHISVRAFGNTPLRIFNSAGAIVHTQTIASPDETIHLGHLPAGMYIIRLENGETVKIIKIQ